MNIDEAAALARLKIWNKKRMRRSDFDPNCYGFSGWYKQFYFRSILELSFLTEHLEPHKILWTPGEDKDFGIPYVGIDGLTHNYFVDYILPHQALFVECKPQALIQDPIVQLKKAAAINYCNKIGFSYRLMTPNKMDIEKMIQLYKSGVMKLSPMSEKEFRKKYRAEIRNL